MSDTRLRDLERRWRETGTSEDETRYLLETVRTGQLTKNQLRLAAYCFHRASGVALKEEFRPQRDWDSHEFIHSLFGWGRWVVIRFAAALAMNAICGCKGIRTANMRIVTNATAEMLRGILSPPAPEFALTREAATRLRTAIFRTDPREDPDELRLAGAVVQHAILTVSDVNIERVREALIATYDDLSRGAAARVSEWPPSILDDIVAWALGNDPLPAQLARLEAEATGTTPITPSG